MKVITSGVLDTIELLPIEGKELNQNLESLQYN